MRSRILIITAALLGLLTLPAAVLAAPPDKAKIDSSLETVIAATGGDTAVPVLIFTDGDLDGIVEALPQGVKTKTLPLVDAVAAYLTPDEIVAMSGEAFVDTIAADNPFYGLDYSSSMDVTNLTIGLGDVTPWQDGGPAGDGITVAVLDSGIATGTDMAASRIVGWKDFVNGETEPYDDAGHGTFVAGLIAGDGTASLSLEEGGLATQQFRGVAPAADVVGIKVLDETGSGRASTIVAGIAWAIANKDRYGIRVLNLSVGGTPVGPAAYDPVARAARAAWRRGIVVVCAAGNEGATGLGGILSPGNDPYVLTVGASDTRQTASVSDDIMTSYSSFGPTLFDEYAKPDLVAPGNRLISLRTPGSYIDVHFPENVIPLADYVPSASADTASSYLMLSGTSAATPVVAGAAALLLGEDPSLTPDDVKTRLTATADPITGASVYQQGAGTLDIDEALASTDKATAPALSADLGNGLTVLTKDNYAEWYQYAWERYGWLKFKWTKFKWTDYGAAKFKWTKFKWTEYEAAKFKWTKFKWTEYEAAKFKWTKFKWTVLLEGQ